MWRNRFPKRRHGLDATEGKEECEKKETNVCVCETETSWVLQLIIDSKSQGTCMCTVYVQVNSRASTCGMESTCQQKHPNRTS